MSKLAELAGLLAISAALAHAPGAGAHPFAVSSFAARTAERDVEFEFRLDAISVVDLINRARPAAPPVDERAIVREQRTVLRYLDRRFALENDGVACRRRPPMRYELDETRTRAILVARFRCGRDLNVLRFTSTLFLDETTPHHLIGTLRHEDALERYFFTGGERSATIRLHQLKQLPMPRLRPSGRVRVATPPPSDRSFAAAVRASEVPASASRAPIGATRDAGEALRYRAILGMLGALLVIALATSGARAALRRVRHELGRRRRPYGDSCEPRPDPCVTRSSAAQ